MDNVDISVVIVNYNVKDFLLQCLRSVEKASKKLTVQTIVVDNNSTDGSVDFLQPLFPNVDFVPLKENIGFGRANNLGFKRASGKYILILNPDTIVEEDNLDHMFQYMEEHSEVGIAGCKVLNPDGTFQLACRRGFPTPWASFSKLFGLQKLFPKSKLFAKYNQTFRSIDETYYIDAVIGAYMFARKEALDKVNSFDPAFFMYGEDIDLCYRVQKEGWKIAYVHSSTIIHYKGESTKRSSINEIKHFYEAMEIFADKHYSKSSIFLLFLRLGIALRALFAKVNLYRREIVLIISDIFFINMSLLIATKFRFGEFFNFPDYAYPTVFIVISAVLFLSMLFVGEYFESRSSVKRSFFGLLASFFILSSLTYFFKEYAFSRGIILMTVGFTIMLSSLSRLLITFYDNYRGKESDKRIAIVGINEQSKNIIRKIEQTDNRNANLVGVITVKETAKPEDIALPLLGNAEYLSKLITEHNLHEIIISDDSLSSNDLIKMIANTANPKVRFHVAQEYEEVLAARITDDIAGFEPTVPKYNITLLRFKLVKRFLDIAISLLLLSVGLPILYLVFSNRARIISRLEEVLRGKMSLVGIFPVKNKKYSFAKPGIIGLAHISHPERLSGEAIMKLNDYYLKHYTVSLDIDIFFKYILRKKSG